MATPYNIKPSDTQGEKGGQLYSKPIRVRAILQPILIKETHIMAWLAQIIFFGSYFIAWITNELPHTTWVSVSAIAAIVIAVLLLVDNRAVYMTRPAAQ
jgi:hypothetical protein